MSIPKALTIGVLGLILNGLVFGPWALSSAFLGTADASHFGDFTHFYVGACLAGTGDEYDSARVLDLQQRVTGVLQPHLLPSRLPFYYHLLRPLCWMSYSTAHYAWLAVISVAAAAAIALLWLSQGEAAIAAALASAPLFLSIVLAQDDSFLLLVLAAGLWLHGKGRPGLAGLVLSLLWIKFHLFVLLPVMFLIKREFRLVRGAQYGSAALLSACFAFDGWKWPPLYARLLMNPIINLGPELMPNLHGVVVRLVGLGDSPVLEATLSAAAIGGTILVVKRSEFPVALGAASLGSLLISHHAYPFDCVTLIPGLLAIWRDRTSPARELALICLIPFPYFLSQISGFGWVPATLFILVLLALVPYSRKASAPDSITPIEAPSGE